MNKTSIEWVRNPGGGPGFTWNPITGCLNGCSYCYARKLANGRLKSRYLANRWYSPFGRAADLNLIDTPIGPNNSPGKDPFYPRFWKSRLYDPVHYNRAGIIDYESTKGIFVCNMGELFGNWVPPQWQEKIFQIIDYCPNDRFYLLTKQPQNLQKFSPFPDNCWVGVSVTNAEMLDLALLYLNNIEATIKYISFEPLLENPGVHADTFLRVVDWVIVGAQTKPTVCPQSEWVADIVVPAKQAGIPVFIKDNMKKCLGVGAVMQEMPK